jgi:hypothetical protein
MEKQISQHEKFIYADKGVGVALNFTLSGDKEKLAFIELLKEAQEDLVKTLKHENIDNQSNK